MHVLNTTNTVTYTLKHCILLYSELTTRKTVKNRKITKKELKYILKRAHFTSVIKGVIYALKMHT